MTNEPSGVDWERLQTLFHEAVALPPAQWPDFLDAACGADDQLRAALADLLARDANAPDTLTPQFDELADAVELALTGQQLGPYRLLKRIGVGGMGSVFLAERADGAFERQVAVKVVKKGMDTASVIARFELERRILARLSHANIASLLDGGLTDDGRPYFVLEYVDGEPITDYCDRLGLSISARLALFRTVCDAVHHAHQSLIVHRDLKPSNILVTASGQVKLLDFGIAKLLDPAQAPAMTRTGAMLFTPVYAAPEQFLQEDVTIMTDVYALGVVLYELLSGRRPFEVGRTPAEYQAQVLSGDPQRPSTALTQQPAAPDGAVGTRTAENVSAARASSVDRLRSLLKGDLDTICMMALRRDPGARYASAEQMASDVQRHLLGQPVIARPDTLGYRVGKFVRRNRIGVLAATLVLGAFALTIGFYTERLARERDMALAEQRKTGEVVEFVTGLFEVANPAESRGRDITARELLDAGYERLGERLTERPVVRAEMLGVLADVYYALGDNARAESLYEEALALEQQLFGSQSLAVAATQLALGMARQNHGDFEGADELYRRALTTRQALLGPRDPLVREALSARAFLEETEGDYAAAESLYLEALTLAQSLRAEEGAAVAQAQAQLAGLYRLMDRPREAEPLLREALATQDRVYQGEHPVSAQTKRQLAGILRDLGRFEESRALYLEVLETRVRLLGPNHREVAHTWNGYAELLIDMGELEEAAEVNRKMIDILEEESLTHPSLGAAYNNLGFLFLDLDDAAAAVASFEKSLAMQDAAGLDRDHPNRTFPATGLGVSYAVQGRFAEAEQVFREMLRVRRQHFPEDHRLVSELKTNLGWALVEQARYQEAEPLLQDAYERFVRNGGPKDANTRKTNRRLVSLYEKSGDEAAAARYQALLEASLAP